MSRCRATCARRSAPTASASPTSAGSSSRREAGKKKFVKSTTPGTAWMVSLAQLDDGRIVCAGAGRPIHIFVSGDDGESFTELDHPHGGDRSTAAISTHQCVVARGNKALFTGMRAAVLLIS